MSVIVLTPGFKSNFIAPPDMVAPEFMGLRPDWAWIPRHPKDPEVALGSRFDLVGAGSATQFHSIMGNAVAMPGSSPNGVKNDTTLGLLPQQYPLTVVAVMRDNDGFTDYTSTIACGRWASGGWNFLVLAASDGNPKVLSFASGGASSTAIKSTAQVPGSTWVTQIYRGRSSTDHTLWCFNNVVNAFSFQETPAATVALTASSNFEVQLGHAHDGDGADWDFLSGHMAGAYAYNWALPDTALLKISQDPFGPFRLDHRLIGKVPAVGGATPKGPFGHPFHGPFAGPISYWDTERVA